MNTPTSSIPGLAALAALTLAVPVPSQTGSRPRPPTLESETIPCRDGTKVRVDRGSIEVPEVRSKKGSKKIRLAFVRVRSPRANPGPPVFLLAGGPGGSGIRLVLGQLRNGGKRYLDLLGGDVVGIDQRGVGHSRPNLETPTRFGFDLLAPGDPKKMMARARRVCREEAARWRKKGVDLTGYTTVESADDVDAVRQALGYEKISLWGASYGSHLALATLRRHPEHIARAFLTGPEGPDHTFKLPSYAQRVLERVAALVKADPELGEKLPDLVGSLRGVLDRLEKSPVYVDLDGQRVGISKFDVQHLFAEKLGSLYGGIVDVPRLVLSMAAGDFRKVAEATLEWRRDAGIWSAMAMMMDTSSGMSKARAQQIATEAKQCLLGDAINFPFSGLAASWGAVDLGQEFRGPLRSDVPVLFVVGDLDSRTPVRNAEELMRHLPNASLLVVTNQAHDLKMGHPELLRAWRGFLAGDKIASGKIAAPAPRFSTR